MRKKRPELWKKKSWILHQDNAPVDSTLAVKQLLADNCIPVLERPPYSPDLASCNFYLFPKLKSALKGAQRNSLSVC
jgi:transposase